MSGFDYMQTKGAGNEAAFVTVRRTYNRTPANSPTSPTTLAVGDVVVTDFASRGRATIGGATRTSVGGAPAYTIDSSSSDVMANVTQCDAATLLNGRVHVAVKPVTANDDRGEFVISGRVPAFVWGHNGVADNAIAVGDRLTVAVVAGTSTGARSLRLAQPGEPIHAIALQGVASGARTLIEVRLLSDQSETRAGSRTVTGSAASGLVIALPVVGTPTGAIVQSFTAAGASRTVSNVVRAAGQVTVTTSAGAADDVHTVHYTV